ncbi:hypothetical protein [Candidatus Entotheonella palauensis]|uniref:Uncharacterized protein n=1 Tax=Candidatus Entotheonella gemina TaxID=1429439 RepID=W4LJH7_9BACT|nr:hypothetical protein [Candidatus Entotheonella palauensis]ETW98069.1 MAG: hypothetical protein ETSY2_43385 [Candidatus Entotheonella gemina]
MTKCYVVVEGDTDAAILSSVLADLLHSGEVEIKVGQGRSSAVSLARTMLVSRREALTALVLDADSTNRERIGEMEAELEGSLADVSRHGRFGVFLLVPSIEACLFQDVDGLEDFFGSGFSSEEVIQSRYDPKSVIEAKLAARGEPYQVPAIQAILNRVNLQQLRKAAGIQGLLLFVAKSVEAAPA